MNSAPASSPGRPAAPSILLVGSRPEDTFVFEALLSSLGQPILHATTGQEAVRVAADQDPAVVVLDVVLPDMDGLEAVGLLRMRRRTQSTPVVLHCSRELSREQQRSALAVGIVDVVVKPFDPEALRTRIAALVDQHVSRARTALSTAELTSALREARTRAAQAELELSVSQARVRLAAEAASAGLWDLDPRRRSVRLDPQASHMLGLPPHSLADSTSWLASADSAGRERFDAALSRTLSHGAGSGRLAVEIVVRGGGHVFEARRLSLRAQVVGRGAGDVLVVGTVTELGPVSAYDGR